MNQSEVIKKVRAFVSEHTDVDADPEVAELVTRPGTPPYWWISYPAALFFPKEAAAGCTIDGPYILSVDDESGEITVLP